MIVGVALVSRRYSGSSLINELSEPRQQPPIPLVPGNGDEHRSTVQQ